MTAPLLHVSCSDLNPGCRTELRGGSPDDIVLQYAAHSTSCLHSVRTVDLDDLLDAVQHLPTAAGLGPQRGRSRPSRPVEGAMLGA